MSKKGFTLIELLVVIAIIGILSTVAVVNLNTSREKAKVVTMQKSLASILPGIAVCASDGRNLKSSGGYCVPPNQVWVPGTPICDGSSVLWPELSDGFTANSCWSTDIENLQFSYGASKVINGQPVNINCTKAGCVVNNF